VVRTGVPVGLHPLGDRVDVAERRLVAVHEEETRGPPPTACRTPMVDDRAGRVCGRQAAGRHGARHCGLAIGFGHG
jgi:hypothetical protein